MSKDMFEAVREIVSKQPPECAYPRIWVEEAGTTAPFDYPLIIIPYWKFVNPLNLKAVGVIGFDEGVDLYIKGDKRWVNNWIYQRKSE